MDDKWLGVPITSSEVCGLTRCPACREQGSPGCVRVCMTAFWGQSAVFWNRLSFRHIAELFEKRNNMLDFRLLLYHVWDNRGQKLPQAINEWMGDMLLAQALGEHGSMAILTTLSHPTAQYFPPASSVGSRHTSLDPAEASNAFLCNFDDTGPRNLIHLSNRCVMCWKSHF